MHPVTVGVGYSMISEDLVGRFLKNKVRAIVGVISVWRNKKDGKMERLKHYGRKN